MYTYYLIRLFSFLFFLSPMVSTKASDLTIGKLSAREIAKPPSSARSVDVDSIKAPSSSRSVNKDIVVPSSSRSNPASSETSRSQPVETYRTYMDTGR